MINIEIYLRKKNLLTRQIFRFEPVTKFVFKILKYVNFKIQQAVLGMMVVFAGGKP